jgi:hypothetical protein
VVIRIYGASIPALGSIGMLLCPLKDGRVTCRGRTRGPRTMETLRYMGVSVSIVSVQSTYTDPGTDKPPAPPYTWW